MRRAERQVKGNAVKGETLFKNMCAGCHSFASNKSGPSLDKIFNRPMLGAKGFNYSAAMISANMRLQKTEDNYWNKTNIMAFLANPVAFSGSNHFVVGEHQKRNDLAKFLKDKSRGVYLFGGNY
ncbi:hypothetical protein FGO68_gene14474 [Halteria grandinella]|uniref:Cytochrome c domain-containing protein n=1 Tax=Halteria grandinella TaxID=5974 RepID=A0A8J8SZI2_HALGN|nr:hypothetical protein FGO68_gene14474 [Halteria grandinella]